MKNAAKDTGTTATTILETFSYSVIHFRYFYSAYSSPLLLRGAPYYSIDTVSELTHRGATGIHE